MNIVHFSYSDTIGAFGAAYELHKELLRFGHASIMFVREKTREDVSVVECGYTDSKKERIMRLTERLYFNENRKKGTSLHSIDYLGLDWTSEFEQLITEADIIHLHWCTGLVSLYDIQRFVQMGKRIVWTMHDFHPVTGACHCPENCEKYEQNCSECPQALERICDITKEFLRDKIDAYGDSSIYVTAASGWLKEKIQKSAVFKKSSVFVIPIGINTDVFCIDTQSDIKRKLGLSEACRVILLGAQSLSDNVKGYHGMERMFRCLCSYPDIQKMCKEKEICIVTFGNSEQWDIALDVPVLHMGFISDKDQLKDIYNMADVFLFPSMQDTFGMTATEAMACGTPVIAFDISAMSEVIVDGINGYKAEVGNYEQMAGFVQQVLRDRPIDAEKCRKRICENYSIECETKQMLDLYQSMEVPRQSNHLRQTHVNEAVVKFFNTCIKEIVFDEAINQSEHDTIEKIFWKYNVRFMSMQAKVRKLLEAGVLHEKQDIYIYGAGRNGICLEKELKKRNLSAVAFWDMDQKKWRQTVAELPVEKPKECDQIKGAIVLISIAAYDEAVDILTKKGFALEVNMF